jgi:hypothetical protein
MKSTPARGSRPTSLGNAALAYGSRLTGHAVHFNVYFLQSLAQCCPTFLYIRAHLTDGCRGAGAMWQFQ